MRKSYFCLLICLVLVACSNTKADIKSNKDSQDNRIKNAKNLILAQRKLSQNDELMRLTHELANQLYLNITPNDQSANIAVGTFTDLTTLQSAQASLPLKTLGLQLEEGLMTESVQRGFNVIDYRLRKNLTVTKEANLMLSRELKFIDEYQNIDYFLTGTIAVRTKNILINARLVDVKSKKISAAATTILAVEELGQPDRISLRAGKIYRTSQNSNQGNK